MPINSNIPQCQYIRTDGRRCGSPALKTKRWCYFHYEVNRKTVTLDVPPLEDGNAVQLALTDLARAVADDRIQLKNAALLAYILQTASANLKRVQLGVFTDNMVRDLPELDPYTRGLSIQDPSAPSQSSVILSEASSVVKGSDPSPGGTDENSPALQCWDRGTRRIPSALPKARVSEGHDFNRAETNGAPAPTTLPKARAQHQRSAQTPVLRQDSSVSSVLKKGSDSLPQKIEAAKSGSLKDAKGLLDLLNAVS